MSLTVVMPLSSQSHDSMGQCTEEHPYPGAEFRRSEPGGHLSSSPILLLTPRWTQKQFTLPVSQSRLHPDLGDGRVLTGKGSISYESVMGSYMFKTLRSEEAKLHC